MRFLFAEPTSDDISSFRQKANKLRKFASEKGLLVSGGWRSGVGKFNMNAGTMGGDAVMWFRGMVNGFITIEKGERKEVGKAVEEAIHLLAPEGGFILSPVDNVSDTSPSTWENVLTMIKTWKKLRFY